MARQIWQQGYFFVIFGASQPVSQLWKASLSYPMFLAQHAKLGIGDVIMA